MYIKDGIAYADDPAPVLTVVAVRPLDDYRLWVRFSTGETKTVDMSPLLETGVFQRLKTADSFNSVYIDYGVPTWQDGEIDVAPEYLFENGIVSL